MYLTDKEVMVRFPAGKTVFPRYASLVLHQFLPEKHNGERCGTARC